MPYTANKVINDLEAKATPIDADVLVVGDSADSNRAKKTTWVQIKTVLGALFAPLTAPTFATSITTDYLTASEIIISDASKKIVSAPVATYPSLTELSYIKGLTSAVQTQITAKAPSTAPTFATSITGSYLTPSEILITDANKKIISAAVATYPSLTELSYVKGVTSAIQTQLNAISGATMIDIASDTLKFSNDVSVNVTATSYTKYKEITLNENLPSVRIKFAYNGNASGSSYFRLYKNDVAYGAEVGPIANASGTYSADFTSLLSGDKLQIYAKTSAATSSVLQFRLYFDRTITLFGTIGKVVTPIPLTFGTDPTANS